MPVFRRAGRFLLLFGGLLLSSILFAACGENSPSILNTAGPIANSEAGVFWAIFIIAAIVFVGVEGALIFSIIRYRERPGMPNPRQIHGSMKLEILWTAIPSALLIIILIFTIRGLLDVAPESEPNTADKVNVTVVAHQWWWEFYYDQYQFTTADTLVVPAGKVVHLSLFSNNVIHSFWIPQLTGKTDVVPGHDNTKWFVADDANKTYEGICTEYCGLQHANMHFTVQTKDFNGYMAWVHDQQQPAVNPVASSGQYTAAKGQEIFKSTCESCHGIVGVNKTAYDNIAQNCHTATIDATKCPIAPNLTHFGSRSLIAGGVLTNNKSQCDPNDPNLFQDCNVAKWLQNTQAIKPGNAMVVTLTTDQIRNLVAYLESLN